MATAKKTAKKAPKIIHSAPPLTYEVDEPSTLAEFAEEFKRLEREIALLNKRKSEMKEKVLAEVPPDTTVVLENGIKVQRTTYAATHFMMEEFKEQHPRLHEKFLTDLEKEKVTISYITK